MVRMIIMNMYLMDLVIIVHGHVVLVIISKRRNVLLVNGEVILHRQVIHERMLKVTVI